MILSKNDSVISRSRVSFENEDVTMIPDGEAQMAQFAELLAEQQL